MTNSNRLIYTYIYNALWNGKICRWNKSVLNVYINYSQIGPFLDKEKLENRVKNCFAAWEEALQGKIHFNYIDKHSEATDIYVDFQRNNFNGTTGQCHITRDVETSVMTKAYITLGLIWTQYFDQNTTHEIGHALGICNHSTDNTDIMYNSMIIYGMKLSTKDKNTIRLLYELPIGCDSEYICSHINQILTGNLKNDNLMETSSIDIVSEQVSNELQPLCTEKDLTQETIKIAEMNIVKLLQGGICYSADVAKYINKVNYSIPK